MVREQVGDKETERYFCSEEGRGDCYLRVIFFIIFARIFDPSLQQKTALFATSHQSCNYSYLLNQSVGYFY